jgi:hypothetical protein
MCPNINVISCKISKYHNSDVQKLQSFFTYILEMLAKIDHNVGFQGKTHTFWPKIVEIRKKYRSQH